MAWGKTSQDELRIISTRLKDIGDLGQDILHLFATQNDREFVFWERCAIASLSGLLSNDAPDIVFRPEAIATKVKLMADEMVEQRKAKIADIEAIEHAAAEASLAEARRRATGAPNA